MDCNCNCFGVATAARVPVKRYNLLVPDVFPVVEPSFDKPLGITVERKIKKLAEYLDKNEHRVPKVSRRLQRRLYSELRSGGLGYVKLAVETYAYLLQHSRPEKSNLLAHELVVATVVKRRRLMFGLAGPKQFIPFQEPHLGSAVGLLLANESPRLRKLGVDLLIDFIKCQQTSDYIPQLEAFVPLLCENALPRKSAVPTSRAGSPHSARSAAGSDKATAKALAAWAVEEQWSQLRAACLRALLEHLRFCARLSYVSYHLHTITFSVLECVDASVAAAPQGQYTSPRAALGNTSDELARLESISRLSISHVVGVSPPDVAALLVFEELAHMTRDAAEGKKVLEFVMRFLDANQRWLGSGVAQTSVAVLQQACEQEHQRYLLFSTLLRHVAVAEQLAPAERAAVLGLAVAEGQQLEAGLPAPALLLALRELPAVIASSSGGGGHDGQEIPAMPSVPLPATPTALTAAAPAGLEQQLAVDGSGSGAAGAPAVQDGGAAAGSRQEIELPRLQMQRPGQQQGLAARGPAPPSPPAAAPASGHQSLHVQVLAAVAQLAQRVQDSTQLLEAVGSTVTKLRGAAPISTAALQCCVAAAQAVQFVLPKVPRGPAAVARTFPSLLLSELAGVMVHWAPQQRLLAHALVLQLLPAAPDGLKEQQASALLSAMWHEAALPSNMPAAFVAADRTLRALLGAAPAAALPQVVQMLAALQQEVLLAGGAVSGSAPNGVAAPAAAAPARTSGEGSRLAALPATHLCALLCVCGSALHTLAVQLGQPALEQLAVAGCGELVPWLALGQGEGVAEVGGNLEAGEQQRQQRDLFWQEPLAAQRFTGEEQKRCAAFLAGWRQRSSAAEQEAALAAALAAVPLFKQAGAGSAQFKPMSKAALMPRVMQAAGNGPYANGSSTKRADKLRSVYKHMRQVSLLDGDRVVLATISQETAAEETVAPMALQYPGLHLPGMPDGGDEGGGSGTALPPQSVDDVLADVDAALDAAQAAMARGRSPSPPSWQPLGPGRPDGSSSSLASSEPQGLTARGGNGHARGGSPTFAV